MKPALIWLLLVCLAVATVISWYGVDGTPEPQASATSGPALRASPSEKPFAWESVNGPSERVAFALTFAPTGKALYAGTWGHGVYRSRDRGQTWTRSGTDERRYIKSLAVLPSSDQTLYAGTYKEGLLWSTDGGSEWKQLGSLSHFTEANAKYPGRSPFYVESLVALNDEGRELILAGTHNGVWASGALSDTWTQLNTGFADTDDAYNIQSLAYHPFGWLFAGTLDGLYSSQDGGKTWQLTGPPAGYPAAARRILSLAVVTDTTNITGTLLIGTQGTGVYNLTLAGTDIVSQPWVTHTFGYTDTRALTIQALLAAPEGIAYAGTVDFGVLEIRNVGLTWTQKVEGLPWNSRSILSLARDPADGTLYAGTYGDGVYRLRLGQDQWEAAKGKIGKDLPVDFPVQKMVFAGSKGERLLAGLQVGGLYSDTNRYETKPIWARLPAALPIGPARDVSGLVVSGPDRAFVIAAAGTGIFRSTDVGATWRPLKENNGLPAGDVRPIALAQGRKTSNILYAALAGGEFVYRSGDGGASWQPARGNLTQAVAGNISCMTVGTDDSTVYLGMRSGDIVVTYDAGKIWSSLSSPIESEILELAWSQRTLPDVFLHGGPKQMLYARTGKGIYVSYDAGGSWQFRMRGIFTAILADPNRPHVVYAASPATTVSREFISPSRLTPDLWISYDGGRTWTWAGPSPSSVTTLALDPDQPDMLYAGTEGDGIYRARLPSVSQPLAPGAVALAVFSTLILGLIAYVVQTGISFGLPYRVPVTAWLGLTYLRIAQADELGLVTDAHTALTPLERLALALAPKHPFDSVYASKSLADNNVSATSTQVDDVLINLGNYSLLRRLGKEYRLAWPRLGQIARARFWENAAERTRLMQKVRGESDLRTDTHRFFERSGFRTALSGTGIKITSSLPEYALLGADQGIYVHLHAENTLDKNAVGDLYNSARKVHEEPLTGKLGVLVARGLPGVDACREMLRLWQEEEFRVVPLLHDHVRQAVDVITARGTLARSLRRSMGERDLFRVSGPVFDPLDFMGREDELLKLIEACSSRRVVALTGMSRVGKTSLARQAILRLPNAVVAWIDLPSDLNGTGVYDAVRQQWLKNVALKFPAWQFDLEPLPEQPGPDQIANDLAVIRERLSSATSTVYLVAVLDGLHDGTEPESKTLAQAVTTAGGISLIEILVRPRHADAIQTLLLPPFDLDTSAEIVALLSMQMELTFEDAAIKQLARASGGHPFLLRQLAHLAVDQAGKGSRPIDTADVENAVVQPASQLDETCERLWSGLAEEERQVLRGVSNGQLSPPSNLLNALAAEGYLVQAEGRWRLFSPVLDRWLKDEALVRK